MSNDGKGWRPDPFSGPGWERYFDGRKFTARVREVPAPPAEVAPGDPASGAEAPSLVTPDGAVDAPPAAPPVTSQPLHPPVGGPDIAPTEAEPTGADPGRRGGEAAPETAHAPVTAVAPEATPRQELAPPHEPDVAAERAAAPEPEPAPAAEVEGEAALRAEPEAPAAAEVAPGREVRPAPTEGTAAAEPPAAPVEAPAAPVEAPAAPVEAPAAPVEAPATSAEAPATSAAPVVVGEALEQAPTAGQPALHLVRQPTPPPPRRSTRKVPERRPTPVPPRDERLAAEARARRRRAAGADVEPRIRGGVVGLVALVGAVAAVVVAVATSGSGHHQAKVATPTTATIGSSLPPATVPQSTTTIPLPTSTTVPATSTTAVAQCPTGAVTVSLSLSATSAGGNRWTVSLRGSATNTSNGALRVDSVIADVKNGQGAVAATLPATIADPNLPPHFSTSLSGTSQVTSVGPPTVAFSSAAASWTGAGTGHCPVPH